VTISVFHIDSHIEYNGRPWITSFIRQDRKNNPLMYEFIRSITLISKTTLRKKPLLIILWIKLYLMRHFGITPNVVSVMGFVLHVPDFESFYSSFRQIFIDLNYYFETSTKRPVIIDAGANIGVSLFFFRYLYPKAKVMCFEPDKINFQYLKKNLEKNKLANIYLYNVALSDYEGSIKFWTRSDMAGGDIGASNVAELRHYYHAKSDLTEVSVPCTQLSRFIEEEIDLLKLDIEGSESDVLLDVSEQFSQIKNMVMEYHFLPEKNPLSTILNVLEQHKHVYKIIGDTNDIKLHESYNFVIKSKQS